MSNIGSINNDEMVDHEQTGLPVYQEKTPLLFAVSQQQHQQQFQQMQHHNQQHQQVPPHPQSQPPVQPVDQHYLVPEYMAERPKENAICAFICGPFRAQSWFNLFYLLFFGFVWVLFSYMWTAVTLGLGVGLLIMVPIGPWLFVVWAFSWRVMAMAEVFFESIIRPTGMPRITTRMTLMPPVAEDRNGSPCCSRALFGLFIDLFFDGWTWICAVYFCFIKPFIGITCLVVSALLLCLPIALIGNPFYVHFATNPYGNPVPEWWGSWIVTSTEGAKVTVPIGVFSIWVLFWAVNGMAWVSYKASSSFFGRYAPRDVQEQSQQASGHDEKYYRLS